MCMEKQIDQWIADHQQQMIEDIGKLIRHKSISDHHAVGTPYGQGCKDVLEEMLSLGKSYGFQVKNHEDRCGSICFGCGEKTIGMWGHLDVVPEANGWKYPPYECTQVGDFLIGRGVSDNKGPSVVALYAMRCIKELNLPFHNKIQQVVGCDEEKGMSDVEYYVSHEPVPDFSFVTDCGFPVCYAEKGILEIELLSPVLEGVAALDGGTVSNIVPDFCKISLSSGNTLPQTLPDGIHMEQKGDQIEVWADGFSKHVADPYTGVNAIGKLAQYLSGTDLLSGSDLEAVRFISTVCGDYNGDGLGIAYEDEESGKLTCVGSVIHLEQGRVKLTFNIRYSVTAKAEELAEKIKNCAQAYGWELVYSNDSKPSYYDPDSEQVKALLEVYAQMTGKQDKAFVMGGGTYARKIPNAVAYGPGLETDLSPLQLAPGHGDAHCPDEAQSVSNLLTALKIYIFALLKLDAVL
ncbi:MAG: Sapep family Mn(2+)-dependent dipeptidase [Massiliimalia sp.]|jgi:succinyl-diaminopimelate desuccinylase